MKDHVPNSKTFGLLACLLLLFFSASSFAAEYVSVNKDGVNLRSGPGTNHEILWEVFTGFPLQVIGRQGDWLHTVDFEGDKGWVHSPLVNSGKTVIVKVKLGNMRQGPGTNYETVARVKYGVVFQPDTRQGDWVKVRHRDGTVGWLHNELIWP
jgi:SH3-like domain-containing protein